VALSKLGLNVPEAERNELVNAAHFIEEMAILVKKPLRNGFLIYQGLFGKS